MKRFYKEVAVASAKSGFTIHLDSKPIKTPARNSLILPNGKLTEAIAKEWSDQREEIDPVTMPLTALAEGALDQLANERSRIVGRIASFADSDMLYYRADDSQGALAEHQAEQWDPLLDWARARYDVSFHLVNGIVHKAQPDETIVRLSAAVEAQDDFALAAMLSLVGLVGSLVATLALIEGAYDYQMLWRLAHLEEFWQEEQWGKDDLAAETRALKEAEYLAACKFLQLSRA